ncbi:MAG: hypothetical protein KA765_19045, partial [Thermoflexales bacterium]|nr:hypothetical protein [Thermoflexales bacterium]
MFTLVTLSITSLALANIPTQGVPGGRILPKGSAPNPGTQEQELANITVPAPYNVFEFVVTCAGCHGGTGDLNIGHFGNWAGGAMASAARDPIFRANQQIVDMTVASLTGKDGAGNVCIRCHSPNAWYSGRTDPHFAGKSDASNLEHSILLSTDDEGILCEFCHRSIGNVTMQRADLNPNDPAWKEMADVDDWPHTGHTYPAGPGAGYPYGDNTMQIADGLPYTGKYPGYISEIHADLPVTGTNYTGQTYAIYPPGYNGPKNPVPAGEPQFDPLGREYAYAPDGSLPTHLEVPVGPPIDAGTGWPDYQAQSVSLEHPTNGKVRDAEGEGAFVTTPEFCGTCHDLTVPILNHGMPEQRTYTEWKNSSFGQDGSPTYTRCQDCHMPVQKAEYADDAPATVNADPFFAGWWPYAKDRNVNGGISMHKFDGANIDLPQIMQLLYPQPDLELIGVPTGNDNRVFGGMLSTRDPMYTKAQRNNEIDLHEEALTAQIVSGPTYNAGLGKWEVKVKITNTSGHRIPTGYPDGRRFFVTMNVKNNLGATVYQSGFYDDATAELFTDYQMLGFNRALSNVIDSATNAVMVYERVTATCVGTAPAYTSCAPSPSLLNNVIVFDNRIPPLGYNYAAAAPIGGKYINYTPGTFVPYEESARFSDN